jgi:hypothetical protein
LQAVKVSAVKNVMRRQQEGATGSVQRVDEKLDVQFFRSPVADFFLVTELFSGRFFQFRAGWFHCTRRAWIRFSVEIAPFRQNREADLARSDIVAQDDVHLSQLILQRDFCGGADAGEIHRTLGIDQRKILASVVEPFVSVLQMNPHS